MNKSLRCSATQQSLPTPGPCPCSISLQLLWKVSSLGPSQGGQELSSFGGPASANLSGQHNQPGPPAFPCGVSHLLAFARNLQSKPFPVGCSSPGDTVAVEGKVQVHQKPFSSKTNFIKNQFKQHSPYLCESVAGRRPTTPSHKHGLCPPLGSQLVFLLNIAGRRPAMFNRKAR